jgi:hypothetical protein
MAQQCPPVDLDRLAEAVAEKLLKVKPLPNTPCTSPPSQMIPWPYLPATITTGQRRKI